MSLPRSSVESFERFARLVGLRVEPFQRRIVRAWLGEQREVLTVVPRGNGKSRLAACFALWHLLTHDDDPAVYVGAASRDQARVIFEYARASARAHPAVARAVKVRHLELRTRNGHLRVLASDGSLAHGLTPSLMLADELWAWKGADLLDAFQTALVKRADAKLLVISTAAASLDSPLGRLRSRALAAPSVKRTGVATEAFGEDVRLLEWSLTADEVKDDALVAQVNPAPWIDIAAIRRQRAALHPAVFGQFHANLWGSGESAWLPAGAWQACVGDTTLEPGTEIVVGIDAGKNLSDTAVVWIDARLRVNCEVFEGESAITELDPLIDELARRYRVREVTADPWHVTGVLTAAWQARGLTVSEWPQTDSRLIPASKALYEAVAEHRLVHPNHARLNEHVEGTILRSTRRGARIDKVPGKNNDAVVALIAAHDRVIAPPVEAPRLLGFL